MSQTRHDFDALASELTELRDENEQLRTALETALEENGDAADERDNLRRRVAMLSRELKIADQARHPAAGAGLSAEDISREKQSHTEEELRVAFEELQVLAEELEVSNGALHRSNLELDARVAERTRELSAANATLSNTEAALRTIADLVPDLLWRADAGGAVGWYNKRWYDYTGRSVEQSAGLGWAEVVHPADRAASEASWADSVSRGLPFKREHRVRHRSGSYRWFLVRAEPLRDDRGKIVQWFGSVTDIHDRITAMEALEKSELRFRSLIEGMPQLVWRAVDGGEWTWSSRQWTRYSGISEAHSRDFGWLDAVHPDDRDDVMSAWKRATADTPLDIKCRIRDATEGRYRHFQTRALAVRARNGETIEWLGTFTDVDDLLKLQLQQEVLVTELQHRTRNVMAVVQSIALRTLKRSESLGAFQADFMDRLSALARVQGLLSRREETTRVTFDVLVREELAAHVPLNSEGTGQRVSTSGPCGITLRSATVQTLALALHELSTNAVKYGALSQSSGHLEVSWSMEQDKDCPPRLRVNWRERGVQNMPEIDAVPRGGGFGRELIERALPFQLGARTELRFTSDGVHCTIEMPIPLQASSEEH